MNIVPAAELVSGAVRQAQFLLKKERIINYVWNFWVLSAKNTRPAMAAENARPAFHVRVKSLHYKKSGNDGIKDSYFHMLTARVSAFKVLSLKFRKYRFNDISYIINKQRGNT